MVCMGCTENFPRKYIYICQGCKAWYCKECTKDHIPCNKPTSPVSSSGQDPTLVTSKPQFESEHGLSKVEKSVKQLSDAWLGYNGIIAVYDEIRNGEVVIIVMSIDRNKASKGAVPLVHNGFKVIIEEGKQFAAETKSGRKQKAFDINKFRLFQGKAGCARTQEEATALWPDVMSSLTPAEKDDILDAWGEVSKGNCRPVIDTLYGGHKCLLDEICDKIAMHYIKSNDFIG